MRSVFLAVEQQTPVYLFGIAGLIEHIVLPHFKRCRSLRHELRR
jgi:hypothetical protein